MKAVTPEQVDLLARWYQAKKKADEAKKLVEAEFLLRKEVEASLPHEVEGAENYDLGGGYKATLTSKLTRTIDKQLLISLRGAFEEQHKVSVDDLVEWSPSVVMSRYRTLTKEQRDTFDRAFLIIKPASPTLEVKPPKAKKEE
jgi:hypothetical protein